MAEEMDREILRHFQQLKMPTIGFDTDKYHYCAEYRGKDGMYVHQAMAAGWEPIKNDDPENPMLRDASGYCVMGDVMYMRMPRERWESMQRAQAAILRHQIGEKEEIKAEIDEKISRLVGGKTKASFEFQDRRELAERKK